MFAGNNPFRQNNPFLDLLESLEEEPGRDGGVPERQEPMGGRAFQRGMKVKLPDFWAHAPAMWFARTETTFRVAQITEEDEKFAYVSNALPYETMRLVADIVVTPPEVRPYSALKERLLFAHQLSGVQKASRVMAMPDLGDRRPSAMLAAMLEFCPIGEETTSFFRASFLNRLPADIQVLLGEADGEELSVLAGRADRVWATKRPNMVAAVNATAVVEEDPSVLAAFRPQFKNNKKKDNQKAGGGSSNSSGPSSGGGGGGGPGGRGAGRSKPMKMICDRHFRFGDAAYRCDSPATCAWAEN